MGCGTRVCVGALGVLLSLAPNGGAEERNPRIQAAIDRGVAYLKEIQKETSWERPGDVSQLGIGPTVLSGLTLLECGVPADDAAVQKAAEVVRKNAATLGHTYSLSISIWFLDRLG